MLHEGHGSVLMRPAPSMTCSEPRASPSVLCSWTIVPYPPSQCPRCDIPSTQGRAFQKYFLLLYLTAVFAPVLTPATGSLGLGVAFKSGPMKAVFLLFQGLGQFALALTLTTELQKFLSLLRSPLTPAPRPCFCFVKYCLLCLSTAVNFWSYPDFISLTWTSTRGDLVS